MLATTNTAPVFSTASEQKRRGICMVPDYVELYPFEGSYVAFVHNFLKKNFWRVKRSMSYEDVLQEAAWKFTLLLRRMERNRVKHVQKLKETPTPNDLDPNKYLIANPKHLMSLWKTSWWTYFDTLSNKDTKKIEEAATDCTFENSEGDFTQLLESHSHATNLGYVSCLRRDAPGEIATMYNILFEAPQNIFDTAYETYKQSVPKGHGDKYLNNFICLVGGLDPKIDIVKKFRQYYQPD